MNEEIIDLSARDVSDTIQRGGTILQTARCEEMRTEEGQQMAAAICKKYGIDGLVVIGGDGSFAGAQKLAHLGVNTVGIPGTIDLDIACTEYTIGFDTAVNTAMEAIDKVRDTSTSHERCSIIEVMGRDAGYLALWCGIANGAERILMPEEHDYDEAAIVADIQECRKRGKKNYIIINAEGIGDSINMAKRIRGSDRHGDQSDHHRTHAARRKPDLQGSCLCIHHGRDGSGSSDGRKVQPRRRIPSRRVCGL